MIRRDFGMAVANDVARRTVVPPHREGGQVQYVPPARAGAVVAVPPPPRASLGPEAAGRPHHPGAEWPPRRP